MPEISNPNVDIGSVEAEIEGASRDVQEAIRPGRRPTPEQMTRQVREILTRESWRIGRLSAE